MASNRPLTSFRLLSFDIYGTLIDWETGIHDALRSLTARLPESHPFKYDMRALGNAFSEHERRIQTAQPQLTYDRVLKSAYEGLAQDLKALPDSAADKDALEILDAEGTSFAASIADWPAFPDTVDAMRRLKKRFKLVPVSNVDRASFDKTLHGPLAGVHRDISDPQQSFFDAIYTAQDIGSYKPDLRNFEYLIDHVKCEFGVEKDDILHVAQSLHHDHEPAKRIGLKSVWISRGDGGRSGMGGEVKEYLDTGRVAFAWRFDSLKDLANAVEGEEA